MSAALDSRPERGRAAVADRAALRGLRTSLAIGYPIVAVGAMAAFFLRGSSLGILFVVGLLAFVVFSARPIVPAVLLLILWGTVFPPDFGELSFRSVQVTVAELVLVAALVAVLGRRLVAGFPAEGYRFTWPVAAFIAACLFGAAVGVYHGESIRDAIEPLRALLAFAAFFVLREAFHGRSALFGTWLVAVAAVGSVLVVFGVLTGLPLAGRTVDHVITNNTLIEVERIDPPLLRLLSLVVVMLFCGVALRRRPFLRYAVLSVMIFVELLSFTRSTWVPLILVSLVVPAIISTRSVWLVLAERTAVLLVVSAALLALAASGSLGLTAQTAYQRLESTVSTSTLTENSLRDRTENELSNAIPRLLDDPVTGIGLNLPYGALNASYDPLLDPISATDRRFIHNTPVGIWLWLGLPGVLAALWLVIRAASSAWQIYRRCPRGSIGPPIGAAAGLAALSVQSTFQTNLLYAPALLAVAAGFAYLDVWLAEHRPDQTVDTAAVPPPSRLSLPC